MSSLTKKRRAAVRLEAFEDRTVPSLTTATLYDHMIYLNGNNNPSNVSVSQSGSNIVVRDLTNGFVRTYTASLVNRVQFVGGAAADRFVNNVYSLPAQAWGQGGNDYLEGYQGADTLVGGDGNDTLVGYGGNDRMWGGNGQDKLLGMSGHDELVGDAGHDTLVGGDGDDKLWGCDGNDALVGGAGADRLYGGNGDDSLVTIDGGTSDYANGEAGQDTVWRDKNGASLDIAFAEMVHNVASFANGADRSLDGDSIADPTDGTFYKNFRSNPLFAVGGPSVHDIDQEALGDCWVLGSLGAVAQDRPIAVRRMVADFGDGTYGVRLGANFYRVDADLPTWSATSTDQRFAGLGREGSLWVALVEKAYAHFRTGANTYASVANGDPADAMRAFNAASVGQEVLRRARTPRPQYPCSPTGTPGSVAPSAPGRFRSARNWSATTSTRWSRSSGTPAGR
ncbi:MAG: C2 family cysteine protease [Gemmataceae bacterium]